ncbi:hypothetical protein Taro_052175 [Colocasia esculenta]|uniref:Uncharacterized protein n=1 Tax=Colocasia esculenta TaxID=4460 RepID=A0A843XIY0_COLES|nr:hypothetical protein [Colocasia esculenta]
MCLNVCRFMTPEDLNMRLYVCRFMTPEDLNMCLYVCRFMTPEDLNMRLYDLRGANRRGTLPGGGVAGTSVEGERERRGRANWQDCFAKSRTGGGGRQSGALTGAPPAWRPFWLAGG